MSSKELDKTKKALEELVKVEYMAIAAYDTGIDETEDSKLRKQYNRFRSEHERQARDLNNRLVELGGDPVDYEAGTGKVKAGVWGKITGLFGDSASLGGMQKGAEEGLQLYLNQLDNIHDSKALGIIRRNLESKQDEIRWLEQHEVAKSDSGKQIKEVSDDLGKKAKKTTDDLNKKAEKASKDAQEQISDKVEHKKTGLFGLPVWLLLAVVGAAAFFFMRRQEEPDFSDEAFQYETTDFSGDGNASDNGSSGYHGIVENSSESNA